MQANNLNFGSAPPITNYFVYKMEEYPFNYDIFKIFSQYLSTNQKLLHPNKYIKLLDNEDDTIILTNEIIHIFIRFCQNQGISETNVNKNTVIPLNYLAKRYEVLSLLNITEEYISQNQDHFIIHFLLNANQEKNGEKYENLLSQRLLDYIDNPELLNLSISSLSRIISNYLSQDKLDQNQNQSKIFDFLFKCLDKYGRQASILFTNIDFSGERMEYLNLLLTKYSKIFDFHFINLSFLKSIYEVQSDIIYKEETIQIEQKEKLKQISDEINKYRQIKEEIKTEIKDLVETTKKEIKQEMSQMIDQLNQIKNEFKAEINQCKIDLEKDSLDATNKIDQYKEEASTELQQKKNEAINDISMIKVEITEKIDEKTKDDSKRKAEIDNIYKECTEKLQKREEDQRRLEDQIINLKNIIFQMDQSKFLQQNDNLDTFNILKGESQFVYIDNLINQDENNNPIILKIKNLLSYLSKVQNESNGKFFWHSFIQLYYQDMNESLKNIQKIDEIVICPSTIKMLHKNNCLDSKDFLECIKEFDELHLEVQYPSIKYNEIINCLSNMQKKPNQKFKIKVTISGIRETDKVLQNSCVNLIKIDSTVNSISDFSFQNCQFLTKIEIPDSVTKIGKNSFESDSSLQKITIPSSIREILENSFEECKSLSEIIFDTNLITRIKAGTFKGCSSLKHISIPSSVTHIEDNAFYNCSSLRQVFLPKSLKAIGKCCFSKCSSLRQISIPSATHVEDNAFDGCNSVLKIKVPLSTKEIEPFLNIDDYEINGIIEDNPSASIFNAKNKKTGKKYVLKAYPPIYIKNWKIFYQGISVSNINLPGIIKIQGYRLPLPNEEKGKYKLLKFIKNEQENKKEYDLTNYIIITEYMENGDVYSITKDYLQSKGSKKEKMNPTIRSKIIFGVAATMKQLHNRNVLHRNLTNYNVFLDDRLEPRIGTFTFAKFLTKSFEIDSVGTPAFLAPEVFTEDEKYSFPADVYAFAIFIYKMFSFKYKFPDKKSGQSVSEYHESVSRGERLMRPENISDPYWELVQSCWKQDPSERPTFQEITNILKDDKFAIEEFGMKTNLDELHKYQKRIDID